MEIVPRKGRSEDLPANLRECTRMNMRGDEQYTENSRKRQKRREKEERCDRRRQLGLRASRRRCSRRDGAGMAGIASPARIEYCPHRNACLLTGFWGTCDSGHPRAVPPCGRDALKPSASAPTNGPPYSRRLAWISGHIPVTCHPVVLSSMISRNLYGAAMHPRRHARIFSPFLSGPESIWCLSSGGFRPAWQGNSP